jgi:hypothetical protein
MLQSNETGPKVVQDVVDMLNTVEISQGMSCLMRRIALVETSDGTNSEEFGGIWAVSQERCNFVRKKISRTDLYNLSIDLCLNIESILCNESMMTVPLYSGLVAHLYLSYLEVTVPSAENVTGQAQFWFDYYRSGSSMANKEDFVTLVLGREPVPAIDETLRPGANGTNVVEAVISKLESLTLFGPDHRFMRRLAYVETRDGTDENSGGIWGVDSDKLSLLRNRTATANSSLRNVYNDLEIKKIQLDEEGMMVPLFSAIAARFYLYYINIQIPLAGKISEQADYWISYYHRDLTETEVLRKDHFVRGVFELERKTGNCR